MSDLSNYLEIVDLVRESVDVAETSPLWSFSIGTRAQSTSPVEAASMVSK